MYVRAFVRRLVPITTAVTLALVVASCGADEPGASLEAAVSSTAQSIDAEPAGVTVAPTPSSSTTTASTNTASTTTTAPATTTTPSTTTTAPTTTTTTTAPTTTTTTTAPSTTATTLVSTTVASGEPDGSPQLVALRFESMVDDVSVEQLSSEALAILNDERGWIRAGFTFVADPEAEYRVVLAEGSTVDALCLPLRTGGTVSCQNGPVVALNADRWRTAVDHWVLGVEVYRGYLVNHEVGHLIGQRHPTPRCPIAGRPAGVMEQQTGSLKGCVGNPWPRDWEITHAAKRPVVYAPLPAWGPEPVPANGES